MGKKIKYVLVKTFNPYTKKCINIIFAEKLKNEVLKGFIEVFSDKELVFSIQKTPYMVLSSVEGEKLVGIKYRQLLGYCQPFEKKEKAFVVVHGDFVNTDGGTGIVHMAPTFGADDKLVAEKNNIPGMLVLNNKKKPVPIVNKKGQYIDCMGEFSGRYVKKEFSETEKESLDVDIAVKLKKLGLAFRVEKYSHSYPHCWRTDKPVLYYPLNSWFIKTSSQKNKMLKNNESIFWQPKSTGDGRFKNWLEGLNDWNISRSRFWGTPIPIWKTKNEREVVCVGSVKELFELCEVSVKAGFMEKNPLLGFVVGDMSDENYNSIDLHKHIVDNIILCSDSGEKMYREPDLIDVWFDSGAMPFAQVHYPFENKNIIDKKIGFPADFIAEGVDQTRGWFFTLHAISSMCFNSAAFKSVISNGLVLDSFGQKMSKRLGNAVDPFVLIDKYGSDPVRWYMLTNANPWENIKFNTVGVEEVKRKFFGTLFNTYSFFALYANIDCFSYKEKGVAFSERSLLDRWVLSELSVLVSSCEKSYNELNATKAGRDIQAFVINNLSNWYVRLCRRRFWKSLYGPDKISAFQTLHDCLLVVSKISSPIAPFYTDVLFKDLTVFSNNQIESVHLSFWPNAEGLKKDLSLIKKMRVIQVITSLGLSLRKKLKIRVRQPLSVVSVILNPENLLDFEVEFLDILKNELNVRSVNFVTQSSSFVEKKLTPNFRVLGKKHKKLMKELVVLISKLNKGDVVSFEEKKQINLTLGDKKILLEEEDLILKTSSVPGWSVVSGDGVTVALDTKINQELLMEGVSREFINRVQNIRKGLGFCVTDCISVFVFCEKNVSFSLKENLDYVKAEVLANEFVFEKNKPNICEEVEINGSKVYIAIKLNANNG